MVTESVVVVDIPVADSSLTLTRKKQTQTSSNISKCTFKFQFKTGQVRVLALFPTKHDFAEARCPPNQQRIQLTQSPLSTLASSCFISSVCLLLPRPSPMRPVSPAPAPPARSRAFVRSQTSGASTQFVKFLSDRVATESNGVPSVSTGEEVRRVRKTPWSAAPN